MADAFDSDRNPRQVHTRRESDHVGGGVRWIQNTTHPNIDPLESRPPLERRAFTGKLFGPPRATARFTRQQLEVLGMVGVYEPLGGMFKNLAMRFEFPDRTDPGRLLDAHGRPIGPDQVRILEEKEIAKDEAREGHYESED